MPEISAFEEDHENALPGHCLCTTSTPFMILFHGTGVEAQGGYFWVMMGNTLL